MTGPGIPPSADRIQFRRRAFLLMAAWVAVCAIAGLFIFVSVFQETGEATSPLSDESESAALALAETLRATAYAAMQHEVQQHLDDPEIANVLWRDNVHQSSGDTYRFDGILDLRRPDGTLDRFPYRAVIRYGLDDIWHLDGLRVGEKDYLLGQATPGPGFGQP